MPEIIRFRAEWVALSSKVKMFSVLISSAIVLQPNFSVDADWGILLVICEALGVEIGLGESAQIDLLQAPLEAIQTQHSRA